MNEPIILDTTLRDGEQSPGLYFTSREKVRIARELDGLGIDIIEVGVPAMGAEEQSVISELAASGMRAEILAWNRLCAADVETSLSAGARSVHLSAPTSRRLLEKKLGRTEDWLFSAMEEVIRFAIGEGLSVSFGAEDASRSDMRFLKRIFRHAQDLGAGRVRYADTLGLLTPELTRQAISTLADVVSVPIDFHGHNDFGLATANAFCAWEAGARVISCSLMGWGERAGNAALEEFVAGAHFLKGRFPDFDFVSLRRLCESLAEASRRPIPSHKPIFGSEIFKHESGIHVDGLLKDLGTYEIYSPEVVGGKRELIPGKHSGRAAIKYIAAVRGKDIGDRAAQSIIDRMRARLAAEAGIAPEELFRTLLEAETFR
jgi:homocitrate synthase NifV